MRQNAAKYDRIMFHAPDPYASCTWSSEDREIVVVYRISRNYIRDTTSHLTEPPDVAHESINTDARHVRRLCWEGGAGSAAGAEK